MIPTMSDGPMLGLMKRVSGSRTVMLDPSLVCNRPGRFQRVEHRLWPPPFPRRRPSGSVGAGRQCRDRAAVELDELEGLNRLRLPIFDDFEIGLLQVRDGRAALIRNDDVDPYEIDSRAELRRLTLVGRILPRCRRSRLATIAAGLRGLGILSAILLLRGDGVL